MKQNSRICEEHPGRQSSGKQPDSTEYDMAPNISVTLLTGGGDRPYVFGLATSLISEGVALDIIGSDILDFPVLHGKNAVTFLNLRGSVNSDAGFLRKVFRVTMYYAKLLHYASTSKPKIFHILWNNKLEHFDRTILMLFYKLLGKRIVRTAHNVNAGKRDSNDGFLNRFTLRIQYRLSDHIFVHTEKMKLELAEEFGMPKARVSVIPFGINNSVPTTCLTSVEARQRLGIRTDKKTILFFGRITPYKGLEYLIEAYQRFLTCREEYQLIIAGIPKNCESYWAAIRESVHEDVQRGSVLVNATFIPDCETEVYFKAADVLILPYRHIYQSGVLFLGYSFGLPAIAADVGSLKDEIVEGETGFAFKPEDPADLAKVIEKYFGSDLYAALDRRRKEIRDYITEKHSWGVVSKMTMNLYADLLRLPSSSRPFKNEDPAVLVDAKLSPKDSRQY